MISFKSLTAAALLSASALAGSPALATQIACHSREQTANTSSHSTFGPRIASHRVAPRSKSEVTTHDDWPADMILG